MTASDAHFRADRPELSNPWEDQSHAWVQWKGTDVCMDVRCSCGTLSHVDGDSCYVVKCPSCGQLYAVNGHVQLHPIEDADGRPVTEGQ